MAKKLYKADRDFDHFRMGEVVELDEDNPYVRTGYLDEWTPEEATAAAPEVAPELSATTVEPVTDGPAPSGDEEVPGGEAQGAGGTGSRARSRGRG